MRSVVSLKLYLLIASCFFVFVFVFNTVLAKVGVGMGAGEIRIDEPIRLGGIYEIPSVRIFNTGDEITTYRMGIAYHQDRHELRPQKEWFSFTPETFTLEPNDSQFVKIIMTVPLKIEPGDYFAFIESGPVASNKPGTSVGVAVATKLYFTLVPANFIQAIMYRTSSLFENNAPWSWIGLGLVALIIFIKTIRKFFAFNITVRK